MTSTNPSMYTFEHAPIAIGGVGGSGTRAVAAVLQAMGIDMGADLNESNDDLSFTLLFKRKDLWPLDARGDSLANALSWYLQARGLVLKERSASPLSSSALMAWRESTLWTEDWQSENWLQDRSEQLLRLPHTTGQWGWKEPNTHVVLPFLLSAMPELRYVHVVRHGLDMAYSTNQNQLNMWGSVFLKRPIDLRSPGDSFAYWCAVHDRLEAIRGQFPNRVMVLSFEQLCREPEQTLETLLDFLSVRAQGLRDLSQLGAMLRLPDSVGRHRSEPPFEISPYETATLKRLGYASDWHLPVGN